MEKSSTSIIVQNLRNPQYLSMEKAIRRMFLITNSIFRGSIIALKNCNFDLAQNIEQRDDELDSLFFVISRKFWFILSGMYF